MSGPTAEPLGQSVIKLVSNLCFSLFVFSVLVFTVIAVTYQPPDPWLESSVALTKVLSSVRNSTFRSDDSLLNTGEDLVPLPSPPLAAPLPEIALFAGTNCTDDLEARPIDCAADPRMLPAVRAFNQRIFKSIVFLDYQTPAPGGRPNECDVAWRFRNKKEKSWRRYRDFRRFSLVLAD